MDYTKKCSINKYDRVMPRVYNRSRSSLKSNSCVTRHQTTSTTGVGGKPSVSSVSSAVFSDLPIVLNDYKPVSIPEKLPRRPFVVKPRRTLKSLDPALSPSRVVRQSQELKTRPHSVKARASAPSVLALRDDHWPESHMRQCLSSRSHNKLKELKDEIKTYKDFEKMVQFRNRLHKSCGVVVDDTGQVAEDKAVQVVLDEPGSVRRVVGPDSCTHTASRRRSATTSGLVGCVLRTPPRRQPSPVARLHPYSSHTRSFDMSSDKKTNVRSLTLRGIQLIDTVHKWRPLWDRTTPLHKNMKVLKYCWNQVAIELGSEDQLVKKKWKLLRDYFFRSLRECKANDKPDSWDKFITWPYYDKLQFLTIYQNIEIDHTKYKMNDEELKIIQEAAVFEKKQRTLAKLNSSLSKYDAVLDTDSPLPSPVIVLDDSEQESVDNTDNYQPPPFKILKPATSSLQKDVIKPIATLTEPPPLRLIDKKKLNSVTSPKLQQNYPSSSKTSTPPPNIIGSNFTDSESDAADLHFFQSLLPFMRQFPLKDKIRVRNGIHDLILNELNAINPAGDATRPEPLNEYIKYESEELQTFPTTSYDGSEKTDDDQLYSVIIKEEYENDKKLFTIDSSNITFEGDDENEMF